MSENKKKYAYWLEPSLVEEMESMLHDANATSNGDFSCFKVDRRVDTAFACVPFHQNAAEGCQKRRDRFAFNKVLR